MSVLFARLFLYLYYSLILTHEPRPLKFPIELQNANGTFKAQYICIKNQTIVE